MSSYGRNDNNDDRRGESQGYYEDNQRGESRGDYDNNQRGGGGRDDYNDNRRGGGGNENDGYQGGGNRPQGGSYPAGGYGQDDDLQGAAEHASRHAGSSGDSSMFSNLLGSLSQNKGRLANEDVDEDDAVRQHKKIYGGEDDGNQADDRSMGSAAAMQALKMFSGGGSGSSQQGNSQSAFIGTAMAEASKLFDQKSSQGAVSSGSNKESAVMQAGEMALKFYMKSQGGSSSSSGLMGLASKFM